MNYKDIVKIIKKKLGTSIKIKRINTSESSNLNMDITIGVPFLNNFSDELMFNLITKRHKTFLTDGTWLNDDLESMGLFDNKRHVKIVQRYIIQVTNNGELPIKVMNHKKYGKELIMPINNIQDIPFSIEMFAQKIIEIIASAQTAMLIK